MSIPVAARFRAIITEPLNGSSGISDHRQNGYESYGGVRFQEPSSGKRKRDNDDAGPSTSKRIVRISDDERVSTRESTIAYEGREALLTALHDRFKQGPNVEFHGTYETSDPVSNHKARIKALAIEIWKATGYRFTVKDHPQVSNGYKTRYWCSQDDAHRSKSARAARKTQGDLYRPRQSSSGEVLAKNRFPCRSRLLISSRDLGAHGRSIVTIRIHHHVAHEPYVDSNLPPEVAQDVYWISKLGAHPTSHGRDESMSAPRPDHAVQQDEELPEEDLLDQPETSSNIHPENVSLQFHPSTDMFTQDHEPTPPSSHSTTSLSPSLSSQTTDIYHRRMHAHIRNLRDFCDGLEFQLQFNDFRMLEVLEREGAQFLDFVGDCLKKEGRLVSTDQDVVLPTSSHLTQSQSRNGVGAHVDQPIMAESLQMPQPFEANPNLNLGILPR